MVVKVRTTRKNPRTRNALREESTDLLGEPPQRTDWVNAVANALSEGRRRALSERPSTALAELFDNMEKIQSLQTVLADLIEKLISRIEGDFPPGTHAEPSAALPPSASLGGFPVASSGSAAAVAIGERDFCPC